MTFTSDESRAALVSALHELIDRPVDSGLRPPVLSGGCVLHSLLDPAVLDAIAIGVGTGAAHRRADTLMTDLRDEIDGVLLRALFPVQVRTRVGVHLLGPCPAGGWPTFAGDAFAYTADSRGDGWWTGVHLLIPLVVPEGTRWSLHGPHRDDVLAEVGGAGLLGPLVQHTLEHPALTTPLVWLDVHTLMRFRPSRYSASAGSAAA